MILAQLVVFALLPFCYGRVFSSKKCLFCRLRDRIELIFNEYIAISKL